jgi:hypothetical protein
VAQSLTVNGNVSGCYLLTGGLISSTGNITSSGNVSSGNVLATTTVSAASFIGSTISVTGNATSGTVLTSGLISATGNIIGGNLTVDTGTVTLGGIVNANANGVGNIGSSSLYFDTVFAQATSAQYADLAENYLADAWYEPGTVVILGGEQEVTRSYQTGDSAVAGVISSNPAYKMNSGLEGQNVATVALIGRVPCYVTGPVRKGQLMVTAPEGRACACADPKVGTVIGKALQDFDGNLGTIEILVGKL